MEKQLVWEKRFNIGVDVIDKEHQKLFRIINKLFTFGEDEEKSEWVCREGIKYFKDHAMKHFADEEAYMESINYSGIKMHKRIHDDFQKKTLPALEKELEETKYSADAVSHFLGVCTGWLIGNTLTEDHAIVGRTMSKWKDPLPEEMHEAMRQTILQLLGDMFQLNAKVVSESYGGEKFGNGIYYRLTYSNQQRKTTETILVFEEKLLINTIGKMMGVKTDKLDATLVNAVRFAARQFVDRVMEQFPALEEYKIKAENLLTYEQFEKVFERKNPQFSLLYDTGAGYFAYCAIAPQFAENGSEKAIRADNAMVKVKEFLENSEANESAAAQKKKILVVDDSGVVLKAINDLLSEDYEISLAKSGLSAIRSITLNRPDLVLLDYEMPVCNGKQVLEMIRSEGEFADIAVIFLTGRVDKESVQKVLSLKPAGYLSKNLKPAVIKKNIDEYFKRITS